MIYIFLATKTTHLLLDLQTHAHYEYCQRNSSCSFGFQKASSSQTLICWQPGADSGDAQAILHISFEVLAKVHIVADENNDEDITAEEILQTTHVSLAEYIKNL